MTNKNDHEFILVLQGCEVDTTIQNLIATVDDLKKDNAEWRRQNQVYFKSIEKLQKENAELKAEGIYWKHTAAKWMPGKEGRQLKRDGWGKNYGGLNGLNHLQVDDLLKLELESLSDADFDLDLTDFDRDFLSALDEEKDDL